MYHHSRLFEHVSHSIVHQIKLSEILPQPDCSKGCIDIWDDWHEAKCWWEPCYLWLEERLGFYPLFLGVGKSIESVYLTGYQSNWRRVHTWSPDGPQYYPKGKQPNQVLFSWINPPHPALRFTDYHNWHCVLNSVRKGEGLHEAYIEDIGRWERSVLRESWKMSDWLRLSRRDPYAVQAHTPELDLRSADRIWCRSKAVRKSLLEMGFSKRQIEVQRISVEYPSNPQFD